MVTVCYLSSDESVNEDDCECQRCPNWGEMSVLIPFNKLVPCVNLTLPLNLALILTA